MGIIQVLNLIILIKIGNIRKHYKEIKRKYNKIYKLGCNQFETLHRSINPTIEEIKQLTEILVINTTK